MKPTRYQADILRMLRDTPGAYMTEGFFGQSAPRIHLPDGPLHLSRRTFDAIRTHRWIHRVGSEWSGQYGISIAGRAALEGAA